MENYKGIYYNDTKEQKYYEGGAHFKYKTLFNILLSLGGYIIEDSQIHYPNNSNKKHHIRSNKDINSLLIKVEGKQSKYKTRNLGQFNYVNNPNTQIKQSQNSNNMHKKHNLSLKDYNNFHSRKSNLGYSLEKKNSYCKRTITSISLKDENKKNFNNNLIHLILSKKDKNQKNEENRHYSKLIHSRNNSEAITNINNILFNKINVLKKFDTQNKSYIKNINSDNKSIINKSNDLCSLEINGRENNKNDKLEKTNIENKIRPYVYGKSKITLLKENPKICKQLTFYNNNFKKSRNIINKKIVSNNLTNENNKNNDINCNNKKYNQNYLFSSINFNTKKENENLVNDNINNNISSSYNNNIFHSINIKNKEKVLKTNGKNIITQKYIRKKVNQICSFNQNNCHIKKQKLKQKI